MRVARASEVPEFAGKAKSPWRRSWPVLLACAPKFGCPLCWPVLAACCSFLGMPFRAINPLFVGCALASAAVLIVSLSKRRWTLCLMLAGLFAALALRFFSCPAWTMCLPAGVLLVALLLELRATSVAKRDVICLRACSSIGKENAL